MHSFFQQAPRRDGQCEDVVARMWPSGGGLDVTSIRLPREPATNQSTVNRLLPQMGKVLVVVQNIVAERIDMIGKRLRRADLVLAGGGMAAQE